MESDPSQRRRSLLGGALTAEYGPCSIAASELASSAMRFAEERSTSIEIWSWPEFVKHRASTSYVVSNAHFPVAKEILKYNIEEKGASYQLVKQTGLALVQGIKRSTELVRIETKPKSRFKRSVPQETQQERVTPDSLWLADTLAQGKVLLPIATFELRTDGNCNYVQLGNEINDDSNFSNQGDELTDRLALIEDFRGLLPIRGLGKKSERIAAFIATERARNAANINVALGGVVASELSTREYKPQSIAVVEPDDSKVHYDNAAELMLGKTIRAYKISDNCYMIGAMRRGNVVVPIAECNPEDESFRFIDTKNVTDTQKTQSLLALRLLMWQNPECTQEFKNAVQSDQHEETFIMDVFHVEERLKEVLSPTCEQQERLATVLGRKALGMAYSGTANDVYLETTTGSVTGSVTVDRVNDIYTARITAKPTALHDMPSSQILSFAYDPTGPLNQQLPSDADAEDIASMIEAFDSLQN